VIVDSKGVTISPLKKEDEKVMPRGQELNIDLSKVRKAKSLRKQTKVARSQSSKGVPKPQPKKKEESKSQEVITDSIGVTKSPLKKESRKEAEKVTTRGQEVKLDISKRVTKSQLLKKEDSKSQEVMIDSKGVTKSPLKKESRKEAEKVTISPLKKEDEKVMPRGQELNIDLSKVKKSQSLRKQTKVARSQSTKVVPKPQPKKKVESGKEEEKVPSKGQEGIMDLSKGVTKSQPKKKESKSQEVIMDSKGVTKSPLKKESRKEAEKAMSRDQEAIMDFSKGAI